MKTSEPALVRLGGRLCWRLADGRLLPLAAGGAPEDDDGDAGKDDEAGKATGEGGKAEEPADTTSASKARREARELRERLRTAEEERDRLKAAQMSEQERAEARAKAAEEKATGLQTRVRSLALRTAVATHAGSLGIVDHALAAKLLDADKITYGDDDEPDATSVKAALRVVAEAHPVLTRGGDSDGGRKGDAPADGADSMNRYLRGEAPLPAQR